MLRFICEATTETAMSRTIEPDSVFLRIDMAIHYATVVISIIASV